MHGNKASSASVMRILKANEIKGKPDLHKKIAGTASRSMFRLMDRRCLKWNVPISEVIFHTDLGLDLTVPYIKPSDLLTYLLNHHAEVVMGGFPMQEGAKLFQDFWHVYKRTHPTHEVYREHQDSLQYCMPLYFYGDEGRGRRRGNTAVFVLETPFGVKSAATAESRKRKFDCSCSPQESSLKKFGGGERRAVPLEHGLFALHNYKEHSFLTRFVLFVLPCSTYKAFPTLITFLLDLIAKDMRRLFFEGISVGHRTFTPVCVGLKADIKFHGYVAGFSRWYANFGRATARQCCHECLGGDPRWPVEDLSEEPIWHSTMWAKRPWDEEPVLSQIPFDSQGIAERLYKRDPFHICKMGLYRHVTASILAVCIIWGYLDDPEASDGNGIPVLIKRAYGHFRLWKTTFNKSPALRSFSKSLMNWPNLHTAPWFNVKGSDVTLLMKWLDTFLGQLLLQPKQPEHVCVMRVMRTVLQSGILAFDIMTSHRLLLHRACAVFLYEKIVSTLNGYSWLAEWSLQNKIVAFAMVPKVHSWKHEAVDLYMELKKQDGGLPDFVFNRLIHSCEVNEDTIGRISRLSRKVDSRQMERRCLQLFLSKCHFLHKRAFPSQHA